MFAWMCFDRNFLNCLLKAGYGKKLVPITFFVYCNVTLIMNQLCVFGGKNGHQVNWTFCMCLLNSLCKVHLDLSVMVARNRPYFCLHDIANMSGPCDECQLDKKLQFKLNNLWMNFCYSVSETTVAAVRRMSVSVTPYSTAMVRIRSRVLQGSWASQGYHRG